MGIGKFKEIFQTTALCAAAITAAVFGGSACTVNGGEHIHAFGGWQTVRQADCTTAGLEERLCSCGEKEEREISAPGHAYGEWQKTVAEHYKTCGRCKEESGRSEHIYNADNECACGYTLSYTQSLEFSPLTVGEEVVAYSVKGLKKGAEDTEITVPYYYEGKPVTEIGEMAFYGEDGIYGGIVEINLPSSVKKLGRYSFCGLTGLRQINLPKGLEVIDEFAFYAGGLESAEVPDSVKTVGKSAFRDCANLKTAVIGNGVENVGAYEFYLCPSLERVQIKSAEALGDQIFQNCEALTEVEFGSGVNVELQSDSYIFYKSPNLKKIIIDSNNFKLEKSAFVSFSDGIAEIVFGDSVTQIPDAVLGYTQFSKNTAVKSVTFGRNVKTIGESAFYGCSNITEIDLPEGLESMGNLAFGDCTSLCTLSVPRSLTKIGAGAFSSCKAIERVNYGGSVGQWGLIEFGNGFANPVSARTAEEDKKAVLYAEGKPVTGNVTIDGVEEIKDYAFYKYDGFKQITFGESVKKVASSAFTCTSNCKGVTLQTVIILSKTFTVVSSSTSAFSFNVNFKNVYYNGSMEDMIANVKAGGQLQGQIYDRVWWFDGKTHYFVSADGADSAPSPDGFEWTFGGYFRFDGEGNAVHW